MRTQISFVLEGRPGEHRATMVKEKTRNCTWILPAIHCFYYIRKLFQRQIFFPKFLWYENIIKSNLWNFQARRRRCHQFEDTIFCVIKFLFGNIRLAVEGRGRPGQHGEDHHQAGGRQQDHLRGECAGGDRATSHQVINNEEHFMIFLEFLSLFVLKDSVNFPFKLHHLQLVKSGCSRVSDHPVRGQLDCWHF